MTHLMEVGGALHNWFLIAAILVALYGVHRYLAMDSAELLAKHNASNKTLVERSYILESAARQYVRIDPVQGNELTDLGLAANDATILALVDQLSAFYREIDDYRHDSSFKWWKFRFRHLPKTFDDTHTWQTYQRDCKRYVEQIERLRNDAHRKGWLSS